ncbi:MAG: 50S ribosomal protein L9 [Candidatus Lambdaproteobacteria bacterium]|nr:50S ribosomal protein L9 [Candidatus Lambdaproteobacteria bacterium]
MKVILTQNVPHVGSLGDEVSVKDGYARNFLLPRGMALAPTSHNARQIAHRRRVLEKSRAEAMAAARSEAERLADLELVLQAKAGPSGRLFGSVTNRDVQAKLAELGVELDRRAIVLHEPIKSIGQHGITVKLHTEVKLDLQVRVEALLEDHEPGAEPAAEGAVPAAEGEAAAVAVAAPAEGDPAGAAAQDKPPVATLEAPTGDAAPID